MSGLLRFNPATLALPGGILALIVLMIVPVPAFILDVSFVLNIALSVAILMAAMNAEKPLDFSSFHSVLLFATLFAWRSTSLRPASCWSTATKAARLRAT